MLRHGSNFFCDIQTKKMRNLARGKTHNFSVFLKGFFRPKGYTIEVHAAFEKEFFKLYGDVCLDRAAKAAEQSVMDMFA